MKPRHPAIYVRISDDREGEAKGVGRQLEDCRALVAQRDWPKAAVYDDNDRSAWKRGVVRGEFRRLLSDLSDGTVDAVVVYDSDRFYRQPRELEEFIDVCEKASVTQLTQVTGDVDLGSTDGRLTLRIKAAVAVKESDDKSRRIKRKALELAQDGKVGGGGTRPFGFEQDRVTVRDSEAAVIVDLKDRLLAGESVRSLAFDLGARRITTTTGKAWAPTVLRRMLKSARISGRREHKGEIVATAEWPPIITAQDSDRLRAVLSDPARRKNERARSYLLAGMLRCGHCGESLVSRPRDDGRRRYVCARRPGANSCGKLAIVSDKLEEFVVEMVLLRLEGPELSRALAAQNGHREDVHQQTVDQAAEQLEELANLYAEQKVGAREWLAARAPIEERLRRAESDLARSNGSTAVAEFVGTGSNLRELWGDLPMSRQRAILAALIDQVAIGPAVRGRNRFDPDRVAPVWQI
jgi:DNA invertase Pin-like site-specific DNA recombinase